MDNGTCVDVSLSPSNAELIERCRSGQPQAWNELVRRYQRLVYAIPLREGLDVEEAAEVTQHAFAALVKDLHNIREPSRLSSWLMTVARREVWRRRQAASEQAEPVDFAAVEAAQILDAAEEPDWTERQAELAWIYDAIQSLGEPCRSLVFGLFLDPDEPSYASMAVSLGRPIGSIGPLRARCLERLRRALMGPE